MLAEAQPAALKPHMADPLDIPDILTLPALQTHMDAFCEANGWHSNSAEQRFLLLAEEIGELAKAIRRSLKLQIEQDNPVKPPFDAAAIKANLEEEFADVLNYLLDLANIFEVDLEKAYRDNIAQLQQRVWK